MLMTVQPIPTVSERVHELRALTAQIVNKKILPNENLLLARRAKELCVDGVDDTSAPPRGVDRSLTLNPSSLREQSPSSRGWFRACDDSWHDGDVA